MPSSARKDDHRSPRPTLVSHPALGRAMWWFVMVRAVRAIPLNYSLQGLSIVAFVSCDAPSHNHKVVSSPDHQGTLGGTEKRQNAALAQDWSPHKQRWLASNQKSFTVLRGTTEMLNSGKKSQFQGLWKWHLPPGTLSFYAIDLINQSICLDSCVFMHIFAARMSACLCLLVQTYVSLPPPRPCFACTL